jgi:hypothetical protein
MTARAHLLITAILLTAYSAAAQRLDRQWTILPAAEGKHLLDQCSRSGPADVTAFWTPSAAEVEAVEECLPLLARESKDKILLSRCRRQYIGYISHGKKFIYVNAFPDNDPESFTHDRDWRTAAWVVCDGGDAYWGVEFDPVTRTFRNLSFNFAV